MTNQEIGKRIVIARERCNLNKKELAEKINVSPSTITRYENGDFERVKIAILESIAKVTGVNPMWLSGNSESMLLEPEPYYLDDDAREYAQFLYDNPEYRVLFDASRSVRKEDIGFVKDMIDRLTKS